MDRNKTPISRSKKLSAILVAAFTLCNFIFVFPAFATSASQQTQTPSSAGFCFPIIHPCQSPTPTPRPTATPSCVPIPIIRPCKSPTPGPTPAPTGTVTPTPTSKPPQLSVNGSFTLTAIEIVGTNAHLSLADPLHPTLSFSAVTIQGLKLTHLSITLSANGTVSGSGVAIKTSVFKDLVTALRSFTNKADLLVLLVGKTVKTLVMKNVTLQVDRFIQMQALTVNGLSVS